MSQPALNLIQEGPYERPSVHYQCSACLDPTPTVHTERNGDLVCSECHRIAQVVRDARAERLAVIRARRVLAREGIGKYADTGGLS